jgi:hypothetical protein
LAPTERPVAGYIVRATFAVFGARGQVLICETRIRPKEMTLIPCFTPWSVSYYPERGAFHDTIYDRTAGAKIGLFQN